MIRYDIIQGLRMLYGQVKDDKVKQYALELIASEEDLKYRKKYTGVSGESSEYSFFDKNIGWERPQRERSKSIRHQEDATRVW